MLNDLPAVFADLPRKFFAGIRTAAWRIVRGVLIGVIIGAVLVEVAALFLNGAVVSGAILAPTLFVHIIAGLVALLLGYAIGATIAIKEGIEGLATIAEEVEKVGAALVDSGLDAANKVVDAVDGPDRHGFR